MPLTCNGSVCVLMGQPSPVPAVWCSMELQNYPFLFCFLSLQLIGMEWKLGVSMSSNYCKSLGSPHVGLQLKVAGSDGRPTTHTVEMSVPQFQVVCVCVHMLCVFTCCVCVFTCCVCVCARVVCLCVLGMDM